jgi:hypothetical protein
MMEQFEIVKHKKYITSKILELGITEGKDISLLLVPNKEIIQQYISKKVITEDELNKIKALSGRLSGYFLSKSEKCAFCDAESGVTDRGVPLCDKHWTKVCEE